MAEKEQDTYKDIVFGYFSTVSFGWHGRDYGDFSITIYEDGSLMHKTYLFSEIEKTVTKYKISINTVKAIKIVIEECQEDIDSFDHNLWNEIYDGHGDIFIFNGKELITWNIGLLEWAIEDERQREKKEFPHIYKYRQYMEKYGTKVEAEIKAEQERQLVIKQERKILSIFEVITQLLEQDGVKLNLAKVNFDNATLDAG